MTENTTPEQASRPVRRRPSVRRTALGLAAAALVAVWLPFTALYATVQNTQTTKPIVQTVRGTGGTTRLITTRTSSGATVVSSAAAGAPAGQSASSVVSRSS